MNRFLIPILAACLLVAACSRTSAPAPVPLDALYTGGELATRIDRNFDRLEDEMYRPDSVFHSRLWLEWPGDAQGRIVLGLVCDARASGREPLYLQTILDHYPQFVNAQGYFGPEYDGVLNEQQLSGNGWVLRGLCEYYEWTGDPVALDRIRAIVDGLFMHGKGKFRNYPIDPESRRRNLGDAIGEIVYNDADWVLSSDIGCVFIGMEGLIHAYKLIGGAELKALIDELIARFLEVDLVGIRAQTHASLTACRGLIRYAEITGDASYIPEVQKRWELYRQYGMTEGYQNYNWFCRYDTWSEPCAVVDSYMVAVQLWQHTGDPAYLDQAELIYYNGLCHTQRANGGFGCDFCPSLHTGRTDIAVRTDEASWCCTMRGAEGLSSAANYAFFRQGKDLILPFWRDCVLNLDGFELVEQTNYPFDPEHGQIVLSVERASASVRALRLRRPYGAADLQVTVNGKPVPAVFEGGFLRIARKWQAGDKVRMDFTLAAVDQEPEPGAVKRLVGPLLYGTEGAAPAAPLYHLMDSKVSRESGYSRQIIH
ncbi:MAG: glycoside hydrolase family 127 protein [Bacteroidales bacterium]|nr:glycoside hydrolase family 127 protein [Bacteroidales bacterium]